MKEVLFQKFYLFCFLLPSSKLRYLIVRPFIPVCMYIQCKEKQESTSVLTNTLIILWPISLIKSNWVIISDNRIVSQHGSSVYEFTCQSILGGLDSVHFNYMSAMVNDNQFSSCVFFMLIHINKKQINSCVEVYLVYHPSASTRCPKMNSLTSW